MKLAVKRTLIAGIVCTLGAPAAGLLFTVVGMIGAFHTLGQNGISDPASLANCVAMALVATKIGIVMGVLGLPIIFVSVIMHFATKPRSSAPNP